MNTDERIDRVVPYLRGLAATLNDGEVADAADLIDELRGALEESLGVINDLRAPRPRKRDIRPGRSDFTGRFLPP